MYRGYTVFCKGCMDKKTSWKGVGDWYDSIVGEKGHYYHQQVIIPNLLRLLDLRPKGLCNNKLPNSGERECGDVIDRDDVNSALLTRNDRLQIDARSQPNSAKYCYTTPKNRLLDCGCGQGVLARHLPRGVEYVGIDIAEPLLAAARRYRSDERCSFIRADLTRPLPVTGRFSHAACILALQNIEKPEAVFEELAKVLEAGAAALFVLNHPCFRIPRQSQWRVDEAAKRQTREVFSYMSPQKIPIITHPGKGGAQTWSFHRPLSDYIAMGRRSGFVVEAIEEWCSPKKSDGPAARYEDRARREFPLFMAILYRAS